MPPKTKKSDSIPYNFQGKYLVESDSSIINIMSNYIIHENISYYSTDIQEMKEQENCSFKENEILFEDTQECIPFSYISEDNDSIKLAYISTDTIFKISDQQILKQFKGSLFFNIQDEYGFWIVLNVKKDRFNNLELRLIQIDDESILDRFKEKYSLIQSFTHDDRYIFYLNKKEFLSLMELVSKIEYHEKLIPLNFEN